MTGDREIDDREYELKQLMEGERFTPLFKVRVFFGYPGRRGKAVVIVSLSPNDVVHRNGRSCDLKHPKLLLSFQLAGESAPDVNAEERVVFR